MGGAGHVHRPSRHDEAEEAMLAIAAGDVAETWTVAWLWSISSKIRVWVMGT
jgi:hypothetical protein